MLRCVNLLETYDSGSITVDGVEVGYSGEGPARRRRGERELARIRADIGMVFQLFNLFPHLTARENVMLGLRKVRRLSKGEARDIADHWLARVGLADKLDSLPYRAVGRPAAARRHCPRGRDESESAAARRDHLGARP